jgi:hypothetical protein
MIVINLFAGPGSGKSTTCAGVFSKLKLAGVNCEMALEYAKDKVWENSLDVLDDQIYVFGKQLHRLNRLKGKVDVIITDSPILLSIIYNKEASNYLDDLVIEQFHKFNNLNYYVVRDESFNPKGRVQNHEESMEKDDEIKTLLNEHNISYTTVYKHNSVDTIVNEVMKVLNIDSQK